MDALDLGLYNRTFTTGSIVKLYSYQLPPGSTSNITLDLWRDLNHYMYGLPHPLIVYEKRVFRGDNSTKVVLGNRIRIDIDSREMVEKKFFFSYIR